MMGIYIEEYSWKVFNATKPPSAFVRPRFENNNYGDDDGRVTIRMFGKEFIYSAEWSKYPPETHPSYEPLKDAPAEIAKFLRRKLNREEEAEDKGWRRLLTCIKLFFAARESTYCDGCKKFSWGDVCPYC